MKTTESQDAPIDPVAVGAPRAETEPSRNGHATAEEPPELVIEPRSGWRPVDLRELIAYRDLLYHLTYRSIRAQYAQSTLGLGWAVAQPLATVVIFTIIFGRVVRIQPPGGIPYALFALSGVSLWGFFQGALQQSSTSLISNNMMISKIYFPRLIVPLAAVSARSVNLAVNLVLLALVMAGVTLLASLGVIEGAAPRPRLEALVVAPAAVLVAFATVLGAGLWLSSLAIQYRDVAYSLNFFSNMLQYLVPVIYPTSLVSGKLLPILGLNPMVGVIDTFRASLLGPAYPYHPLLIAEALVVSGLLLVSGAIYFRRSERLFADVA